MFEQEETMEQIGWDRRGVLWDFRQWRERAFLAPA
jgi:hypothetical protein